MKKKLISGLAALVSLSAVFTACSSDLDVQNPVQQGSRTIRLTSQVQGTRSIGDPQATALSESVKVGVFGVSASATTADRGDNLEYSVSGTSLTTTTDMTWPSDATVGVNIYAYAPRQTSWGYNTANTFSVAEDQSSDDGYLASDLVYGTPASNPVAQTESAVALNFVHKMARIAVKITKSTGAPDLTNAVVTITNTNTKTTFNPSTGEVPAAATGETTDIKDIKAATLTAEPGDGGTTVYAAIAPQTITAGTKFVKIVTADSKTLIAKVGTENIQFESGKSYEFTVNVGAITAPETTITLSTSSTNITEWTSQNMGSSDNLYAKFGEKATSAPCSYDSPLYKWTGGSNNLIPIFQSLDGKLANYKTLVFTIDNLSEGSSVRLFFDNSTSANNKEIEYKYGGRYVIDLTTLNITGGLSTVTQIRFGGKSNTGQCNIDASNIYLSTRDAANCPEPYIFANPVMQNGAGNGSYSGDVYNWTQNNSNLMDCFTFSNGELANYSKLIFNIRKFSDGASVRMGYYIGSTYTMFDNNGYSSANVYTIDLTSLENRSQVTKISFGGKNNTGNVVIKASEIILK